MDVETCLTGVDRDATLKDLDTFLAKADLDFEEAAKVTPEYGEAWANRGIVHTLQEDYGTAAQYLSKALDYPMRLTNPALTRAHLGWALFHQKKLVDAAKELRQAKQFQPNMCVATYRLARVYFAREEWEKAAELFQTVSDDPSCGSQEAGYYLMKTRMQQGLATEAKQARDACLKISPQSCIAAQCRADGGALGEPVGLRDGVQRTLNELARRPRPWSIRAHQPRAVAACGTRAASVVARGHRAHHEDPAADSREAGGRTDRGVTGRGLRSRLRAELRQVRRAR